LAIICKPLAFLSVFSGTITMTTPCPVETAITIIGGKWKNGILFRLIDGPQRFGALGRQMPWMSDKVLSRQLKELVAAGVVERRDFGTSPPHVEYALSAHGQSLRPLLTMIGRQHLARMQPERL
jgi:DNA-binding HxlR family transcriptional regulator